jgi:hypothetical protein
MAVLRKPWVAWVVVLAVVAVCGVTLGPMRDRSHSVRVDLSGSAGARRQAASPTFSLGGGPATLTVSATPSAARAGDGSVIVAVDWALMPQTSGVRVTSGSDGLMSPTLVAGPTDLRDDAGATLSGRYRLAVNAAGYQASTVTTTVTEHGIYWHRVPILWVVVLAGVACVIIAGALSLRGRPRSRALPHQRRELE